MSLYNEASLVMVPSAYKDQKVYSVKPFDGSGDLTFSRASNATRVNSSGLVEKVRTNEILQSNSFDTTWATVAASVTSGQSGYDGTSNAWLLTKSIASGRVEQSLSTLSSASNTLSVYVKANASTWCAIEYGTSYRYLNLSTGAVSSGSGDYNVQSLANGWYRFSINSSSATGTFRIYPAEADDISALSGSIFIQNAQAETGDIATDYIATTSAAVSVGPVSGLPRLDYSGGASCPSLLLEPQRTNLFTYSETFENAAWTKEDLSISSNQTISPSGYNDADLLIALSSTSLDHSIYQAKTMTGTARAFSVFAKAKDYDYVFLGSNNNTASEGVFFDLVNGTIKTNTSSLNASIEAYGNGWYRCIVTSSSWPTNYAITCLSDNGTSIHFLGDDTSGIYVWGAQVEDGAYATSYIPTLSSALGETRVADAASKTGISSLIGQTEGTIFVQVESNTAISELSDGTTNNRIVIYTDGNNYVRNLIRSGGSMSSNIQTNTTIQAGDKIALAYANNDSVIYKNGVQIGSDTSVIIPATSKVNVGSDFSNNLTSINSVNQFIVFKTRLSNASLSELTTL